MDWMSFGRTVLALALVIALMLALAWVLRKFGVEKRWRLRGGESGVLELNETLFLDPARRVVIIGRENKRYVVLLGERNELLLDTYEEAEDETEWDDDDI